MSMIGRVKGWGLKTRGKFMCTRVRVVLQYGSSAVVIRKKTKIDEEEGSGEWGS